MPEPVTVLPEFDEKTGDRQVGGYSCIQSLNYGSGALGVVLEVERHSKAGDLQIDIFYTRVQVFCEHSSCPPAGRQRGADF